MELPGRQEGVGPRSTACLCRVVGQVGPVNREGLLGQGVIPRRASGTRKVYDVWGLFRLGDPGGLQRGSQWLPTAIPLCGIARISMTLRRQSKPRGARSGRALPGKTLIWCRFRRESRVFVQKSGKTAHSPNGLTTAGNRTIFRSPKRAPNPPTQLNQSRPPVW